MANVDLVRLLLAAGGDPNRKNLDGTTPLTWCSTAALTEMLIEAGASARYECGKRVEFSSLHNAAGDGDVARLRLLIERGEAACLFGIFEPSPQWTPLHHAADGGHLEAAQLLIDAGADPNCVDDDLGYTAVSLAADRNDLDMVRLLITNGADPMLETGTSHSALDVALAHADKPELLECIEEGLRLRDQKKSS